MFKRISTVLSVLLLAACNSTPDTNASNMGMTIPQWVTNPTPEAGLAASSCVLASNSFSIDKNQATQLARNELAQQLDTRMASLQEEYSKKVQLQDNSAVSTEFNSTITAFTNQSLQGSKVDKVDYATLNGNNNVCVLVTLSEEKTKQLVEKVLKQAPIALSPEDETLLYLSFLKSENQL
jgi:hypothetical protein